MTDREAIDYLHNEVVGLSGIDISRDEVREALRIYAVVRAVRHVIRQWREGSAGAYD